MMKENLLVGLGTDGAASNNDLNMWEEMDTVAKLHKVFTGDPKVISAQQAFELATIRGAQALHLEKEIGSLEAGKRADLLVIDRDTLNKIPLYNVYSDLVYATKAYDVETVIINGRLVMRDRRLLTLNETAVKKRRPRLPRPNHKKPRHRRHAVASLSHKKAQKARKNESIGFFVLFALFCG
jgi:5-methylthioadenosine/S-adenosylhomocysteine deaminase